MCNRRYNNQGCEECGLPHTPCRESDDGIMECAECREKAADSARIRACYAEIAAIKDRWQHRLIVAMAGTAHDNRSK